MGGHDHHHAPYKVTDYKIYKVDKSVPQLLEVEQALARQGLKDPWLR
jgi:NADH dehydrogenase (ubiquinone) 1 beta subcomplex subunit 3